MSLLDDEEQEIARMESLELRDKVRRLRVNGSEVNKILNDLLEYDTKKDLEGLIIIATTSDGLIHRTFFDSTRKCTSILGLVEYMKAYIIDYIKEFGEL